MWDPLSCFCTMHAMCCPTTFEPTCAACESRGLGLCPEVAWCACLRCYSGLLSTVMLSCVRRNLLRHLRDCGVHIGQPWHVTHARRMRCPCKPPESYDHKHLQTPRLLSCATSSYFMDSFLSAWVWAGQLVCTCCFPPAPVHVTSNILSL
jgi:hypothetical protein